MFGQSVAVNNDVIIVGDYYAEVEGISKAGKVHVFDLEGVLLYTLQSPELEETALFGKKVAISENLIIVGERGADGVSADEGRVHLYDLNSNWIASLKAPVPSPSAEFGSFVAVSGDSIAIGERSAVMGEYKAGRVHVYRLGSIDDIQKPVEENTPETEESVIPGYPLLSIVLAILLVSILISRTQKK